MSFFSNSLAFFPIFKFIFLFFSKVPMTTVLSNNPRPYMAAIIHFPWSLLACQSNWNSKISNHTCTFLCYTSLFFRLFPSCWFHEIVVSSCVQVCMVFMTLSCTFLCKYTHIKTHTYTCINVTYKSMNIYDDQYGLLNCLVGHT